MNWTKITQIVGSMLITADGNAIYPIGDRIFNVGDYVWTDGKVAFGHETGGGGIVATTMAKIPILSYTDGKYTIGTMYHTYQPHNNYEADLFFRSVFVNDENNAFFLKANNETVTAYNLLTGKTVFNVDGMTVMDSNISEDGDLLSIINVHEFIAQPGVSQAGGIPSLISEAEMKLYKNKDCIFDFAALMDDIFTRVNAIIGSTYTSYYNGGNLLYYNVMMETKNAVVNKDGSCKAIVISQSEVNLYNENAAETMIFIEIFWTINISSKGVYSIERQTNSLHAPLNDGYYFTGLVDEVTAKEYEPFEIYDSDDKYISTIEPLSPAVIKDDTGASNFNIACIAKIQEGYLIHLRSIWRGYVYSTANNVILLVTKDKQATILKPDYGFNMRFAKMSSSKINILKSNLEKILKGDD